MDNQLANSLTVHHTLHHHAFRLHPLRPFRLPEPAPHSLNHLAKPVEIERIQHDITDQIDRRQPAWYDVICRIAHHFVRLAQRLEPPCEDQFMSSRCWLEVQPRPDVLIHPDTLVCTPQQPTAEERDEEYDAIIPLRLRARHLQLVEEPVHVEEGRGDLIEDERRAVEIDKRSLQSPNQPLCAIKTTSRKSQ